MKVKFVSFGYKYGLPENLDLLIDCRKIKNPYWEENLRELTGKDEKCIEFMLSFKETEEFLEQITNYVTLFLDNKSGKDYIVGFGCTGGQHRSVFVANFVKDKLSSKLDIECLHRDLKKRN